MFKSGEVFGKIIEHHPNGMVDIDYLGTIVTLPESENELKESGSDIRPLLAPNGQPSNLPPLQYAIVRTPAFKAWFGDWEKLARVPIEDSGIDEVTLARLANNVSKIVDENGEPMLCWHGTNEEFNEFRDDVGHWHDEGFYGNGFYFTFGNGQYSVSEAAYYGRIVKGYFIQSYTPFDFSILSKYKGKDIRLLGTQSLVFLANVATMFPDIADSITVWQRQQNTDEERIRTRELYGAKRVPISILPGLIEKYQKELKIELINGEKKSGYVNSVVEEYDYTATGGKKGSYERKFWLGDYDNVNDTELEILLIEEAIKRYDGISPDFHPQGYMTRFPQITEAIKINHDSIMQSRFGDEIVVFHPNQIKLADGTNTIFDGTNPDIRFSKGGNATGGIVRKDEHGKNIVWESGDYFIAVDNPTDARYVTLWKQGVTGKIGVLDAYFSDMGNYHGKEGKWLSIHILNIDAPYRRQRFAIQLYKALLKFSAPDVKGIFSYLPNRTNKKQVPAIYKRFNAETIGNYQFIEKERNVGLFADGGSLEEKREELKVAFAAYKDFMAQRTSFNNDADIEKFRELGQRVMDLKYELRKPIDVSKLLSMEERKSAIPPEIVAIAREELLANKKIFNAIHQAAQGVKHSADTSVDDIVNGKNPDVSAVELYNAFNNTRKALKNFFGEKITLHRAQTSQKEKATKNWASTRANASQYGSNIIKQEINIDNIIAFNTGFSGNYEELIVGKGRLTHKSEPMQQIVTCINRALKGEKPLAHKYKAFIDKGNLFLYHYHHLLLIYDIVHKKAAYTWHETPTDKRGVNSAIQYLSHIEHKNVTELAAGGALPKRDIWIRFNLSNDANFGKWKIENKETGKVVFLDPEKVQIVMYNCILTNVAATAQKIFSGEANKSPISYVKCESADIMYEVSYKPTQVKWLHYNPHLAPNWFNVREENIDNTTYPRLITHNRRVFIFNVHNKLENLVRFEYGGEMARGGVVGKTYIHETDSDRFEKFDLSKIGSGQGDQWLGRGIYLQEKGGFKIETYGKNKIEVTLKPSAKIFEVKETPSGKYRDTFVEWAATNGIAKYFIAKRIEEGLSLKNLLPRDILRKRPDAVEKLKEEGYDGLYQDGELVVYNPDIIEMKPLTQRKTFYHGVKKAENVKEILASGFNLAKINPLWQNDLAISVLNNPAHVSEFFGREVPVLKIEFNGVIVEHGELPGIHAKDAQDYTKQILALGIDAVKIGRHQTFIYNVKAIQKITE